MFVKINNKSIKSHNFPRSGIRFWLLIFCELKRSSPNFESVEQIHCGRFYLILCGVVCMYMHSFTQWSKTFSFRFSTRFLSPLYFVSSQLQTQSPQIEQERAQLRLSSFSEDLSPETSFEVIRYLPDRQKFNFAHRNFYENSPNFTLHL